MDESTRFPHTGTQLLIWDSKHDGLPCIGSTLDLISGRLWFASEKRYFRGEIAEFKIRMGWKRRITCTLQLVTGTVSPTTDFVYVGEFVKIDPSDLQELNCVINGNRGDLRYQELLSSQPACSEAMCAAA
jgi:hypothetical protein